MEIFSILYGNFAYVIPFLSYIRAVLAMLLYRLGYVIPNLYFSFFLNTLNLWKPMNVYVVMYNKK